MPALDFKEQKGQKIKKFTIILTITRLCNLKCRYCYENKPIPPPYFMSLKTAKEVLKENLNSEGLKKKGYSHIEIQFFGGEPFLAFETIKRIVEWVKSQSWKMKYVFFIGTNGTILTEEMKGWLKKNKEIVKVGFSLDGTREAHNINRDNSYDDLRKNMSFFLTHWPHQPAKMTITAETIPYLAESVIELERMGINFTANLVFEDIWGEGEKRKSLLKELENQLERLVDFYKEHPELYPPYPLLNSFPEYLAFSKKEKMHRFCGAGHGMIAVDTDGKIYPCHRFVPWISGKKPPPSFKEANFQTRWLPEKCVNCILLPSCPTCVGFNWEVNKNPEIRTTYHCEAFKLQVLASAKLEAFRINEKIKKMEKLSEEEKVNLSKKLKVIRRLIEDGI